MYPCLKPQHNQAQQQVQIVTKQLNDIATLLNTNNSKRVRLGDL